MDNSGDAFYSAEFFIQENMPTYNGRAEWYKPSDNKIYFKSSGSSTWTQYMGIPVFSNYGNVNEVTSFTPKTVFHAVDRNDSSWLSGLSMPSSRYIDLTLGADGSTYTAPVNGYFYVKKDFTKSGQYIWFILYNSTDAVMDITFWGSNSGFIGAFIPVSKGSKVKIHYNASGDTKLCRFIYAEGEN